MTRKLVVVLMLSAILWPAAVHAQAVTARGGAQKKKQEEADRPPVFKLTLDPAGEPQPALKYKFLPELSQQKPGNGATYYYRALLLYASVDKQYRERLGEIYDQCRDKPLEQLPKEDVERLLWRFQHVLDELETAAYREQCDWDLRLRDLGGMESISFLLPDVAEFRNLGRLLWLSAGLEIANRRYDDAIRTIGVGYKLARDTGKPLTLIHGLVGIFIFQLMNDRVQELIDAPGSPNLYWALAALPRPAIDLFPATQHEVTIGMRMFPFLKDAETADRSAEEWRSLLARSAHQLSQLSDSWSVEDWVAQWAGTGLLMKGYPNAKRRLIAAGFSPGRVEDMPVGQVVAIQASRTYRHISDEMLKWTLLPYDQVRERSEQVEGELMAEGYFGFEREILPIASLLLPAASAARFASVRLDRQIAVLQTIEAIRVYAAAHEGRLPESLDQVTTVFPANDPLSAEPFPYRLQADRAILDVPVPPGRRSASRFGRRYEIVITPSKPNDGK